MQSSCVVRLLSYRYLYCGYALFLYSRQGPQYIPVSSGKRELLVTKYHHSSDSKQPCSLTSKQTLTLPVPDVNESTKTTMGKKSKNKRKQQDDSTKKRGGDDDDEGMSTALLAEAYSFVRQVVEVRLGGICRRQTRLRYR